MDEVGKCEVEDNRNEGETVEAEVEPGPSQRKSPNANRDPCNFGEQCSWRPAILGMKLEREIKDQC